MGGWVNANVEYDKLVCTGSTACSINGVYVCAGSVAVCSMVMENRMPGLAGNGTL